MAKTNLLNLNREGLRNFFKEMGEKPGEKPGDAFHRVGSEGDPESTDENGLMSW